MQHVAIYKQALSLDSVTKRVHVGTTSQHIESDRWLKQAAMSFRIAMQFCYDDMYALNKYAETLCQVSDAVVIFICCYVLYVKCLFVLYSLM